MFIIGHFICLILQNKLALVKMHVFNGMCKQCKYTSWDNRFDTTDLVLCKNSNPCQLSSSTF